MKILLLILALAILLTGCSGDKGDEGVYNDVPDDIAREVEYTTFVETEEEPTYSKGIKGSMERLSKNLGLPKYAVFIIISLVATLVIMISSYVITGAFLFSFISGIFAIAIFTILGLLPLYTMLFFGIFSVTYMLFVNRSERRGGDE